MPINLVFQGGGVRGIAYAGALESMPGEIRIKGVAGTSAGAIVAALLAIGESPSKIKSILEDPELRTFLYEEDVNRVEHMKASMRELDPLIREALGTGKVSFWTLWSKRSQIQSLFAEIGNAWQARGLHRSDKLGIWLSKVFQNKTFSDVVLEDLQIVAADVSRQQYLVYKKSNHLGMPIAQAVHASVSIPVFFVPFLAGTDLLVDGGILSNYPAFLFAESKYPTIGFRLRDLVPPGPMSGTWGYLQALLQTMAEAHDKKRKLPRHVFSYSITTPPHIPFDKFSLTDTDMLELLQAGKQTGLLVKWKEHEGQERKVSFFDSNPDDTLDFSVEQARALYDAFSEQGAWLETLSHDAEFTVRIDRDWTVTYDRKSTLSVKGPGSLFLTRFVAGGLPKDGGGSRSLIDVPALTQETTGNVHRDQIRIPAYNSETQKGYVVFYTPPVSQGDGERTFMSRFEVAREFSLVPEGEPALISYGVQRRARKHYFSLRLRVLTDTELPPLIFSSDFGAKPQTSPEDRKIGTRHFTERLWEIEKSEVSGESVYNITVRIQKG